MKRLVMPWRTVRGKRRRASRAAFRSALGVLALVGAATAQDDFRWSWQEKGATASEPVAPKAAPEPAGPSMVKPGVDAALYAELLKENEALRGRIERADRERKAIEQANERLAREVRDSEQRLVGMTGLIETLNKEKAKLAGDPDAQMKLETRLAAAEREKTQLAEALTELRDRERALQSDLARQRAQAESERAQAAARAAIPQDSDLYRDLEKEHRSLQLKLAELDKERAQAMQARDTLLKEGAQADERVRREAEERTRLEQRLAEREKTDQEQKKVIARLLQRIPDMEQEMDGLRGDTDRDRAVRGVAVDQVKTLKTELERRERQLQQAERMARLLEQSRDKVRRAHLNEKRDMHYNMAVVYVRDGRIREAEAEYLKALRIDPADADTHYNLGILYEEEFRDPRRAIRHYRKYLELNPTSLDADKVRTWLMKLEG